MSYDLHITRRNWWTEDGKDIGFEEWCAYVAADPELSLDRVAVARTPTGDEIRIEQAGLTSWAPRGETEGWFHHNRGVITFASPEAAQFAKAWVIAQHFNARIQGDEGEFYGPDFELVSD
jgi:hypothetical protein